MSVPADRLIRDQLVASTNRDSHGDQISEYQLRAYFDETPIPMPLGKDHNAVNHPVGRVVAKRLQRLPDGALAILVDIEVFDVKAWNEGGGISITLTRPSLGGQKPLPGDGSWVSVDERQFDPKDVAKVLLDLDLAQHFSVLPRREKALDPVLAIVIIQIAKPLLEGFMSGLGERLCSRLTARLQQRPKNDSRLEIDLRWTMDIKDQPVEVVVRVRAGVDPGRIQELKIEWLEAQVAEWVRGGDVRKVVLELPDGGDLQPVYCLDSSCKMIRFD